MNAVDTIAYQAREEKKIFRQQQQQMMPHNNNSRHSLPGSVRKRVVCLALLSRLMIMIGMMVSDATIPNHNPGNDVVRFPLAHHNDMCFCRAGYACDEEWRNYRLPTLETTTTTTMTQQCAAPPPTDPQRRRPTKEWYRWILHPWTRWDAARFLHLAVDPWRRFPFSNNDETDPFVVSEEAHAFFPLFPWLVRQTALWLVRLVPALFLPSTFQGVAVLAAVLVNQTAFVVAALALTDLTWTMVQHERATILVATLFCGNPAGVFFSAAYSESTFAAWTFAGHAVFGRGLAIPAVLLWMAASYTRSNGSLTAAWLLLAGLSKILHTPCTVQRAKHTVGYLTMAILVALPVFLHDRVGYNIHCSGEYAPPPDWCGRQGGGISSLYSYVQAKRWNVGFLRYYQLRQIPNFLLASPILVVSGMAVASWIAQSWRAHEQDCARMDSKKEKSTKSTKNLFAQLWQWAVTALKQAGSDQHEKSVLGSHLLPHYAVLGVVALVGLTIAHVQISTRLICSTCPAVYWYLASIFLREDQAMPTGRAVTLYCLLFNVLGIILHPNWLPWT